MSLDLTNPPATLEGISYRDLAYEGVGDIAVIGNPDAIVPAFVVLSDYENGWIGVYEQEPFSGSVPIGRVVPARKAPTLYCAWKFKPGQYFDPDVERANVQIAVDAYFDSVKAL